VSALPLILASASPRRRELLERAGVCFEAAPVEVDERLGPDEAPEEAARRLAADKARAAAALHGDRFVLAADTLVVLDGRALGKPADEDEARAMLRALSGREHTVVTGYAAAAPGGEPLRIDSAETAVRFDELAERDIEWYVGTGEPMDKAGAYGIQGRAAALVQRVSGSYTNVVGLPLAEALALLAEVGWPGRPGEADAR